MLELGTTFTSFRDDLQRQCSDLRKQLRHLVKEIKDNKSSFLRYRLNEVQEVVTLLNGFEMVTDWYITSLETSEVQIKNYGKPKNNNLLLELNAIQSIITHLNTAPASPGIVVIKAFIRDIRALLNQDIWTSEMRLIISFGDKFSMRRHYYNPEIRTLNLPIEIPNEPWQWSMILHELANLLVVPTYRKSRGTIKAASQSYSQFVYLENLKKQLAAESELFPDDVLQAALEGSEDTPNREVQIRNWIEELLEDSISILAFGEIGFLTLAKMLDEKYPASINVKEIRHPPPWLRLQTALKILEKTAHHPKEQLARVLEASQNGKIQSFKRSPVKDQLGIFNKLDHIAERFANAIKRMIDDQINLVKPNALWNIQNVKNAASPFALMEEAYSMQFNADKKNIIQMWLETQMSHPHVISNSAKSGVAERLQIIEEQLNKPRVRFQFEPELFTEQIENVIIANYYELREGGRLKRDKGGVPQSVLQADHEQISEFISFDDAENIQLKLDNKQLSEILFGIDDPLKCCCKRCCCVGTCMPCRINCWKPKC